MTTASGLTFTGDIHGNFLALDTGTGKTLWHAGSGGAISTSPISYLLHGRQYLLNSSGGVIFAWALPTAAHAGE
jgi:alcohol dehydrogenase (cytochrome c)